MMKREAEYYQNEGTNAVCMLCHHACSLSNGQTGICKGKTFEQDKLIASNYGKIITVSDDPIEKKPLYHWKPGSDILSVAQSGCNLCCPFCQNYEISQSEVPYKYLGIDDLYNLIRNRDRDAVAFTYTEPLMFYEYILDFASKYSDISTVIVSNGSINARPMKHIAPYISAANIDLKSFNEDVYREKLCGNLENVKNSIKILYENNVHIEVTHLIVPGLNENEVEFTAMVEFLADISPAIPLHISRYFPAYKYMEMPTSMDIIDRFREIALNRLKYVYTGNTGRPENTVCECGNILVKRHFHSEITGISNGKCKACGRETDIIL